MTTEATILSALPEPLVQKCAISAFAIQNLRLKFGHVIKQVKINPGTLFI